MTGDNYTDFDPDEMSGPGWTVTRPEEGRGRCIRRTPPCRFGDVTVVVAPHRGTHAFRFVWRPPEGELPKPFMRDACLKGVKEGLATASQNGRRLAFVQVSIIGGSYHDTDTDDVAVSIATAMAVQDALSRAQLREL